MWGWSSVCDCFEGGKSCGGDCVEESLAEKSLFHNVGVVSVFLF